MLLKVKVQSKQERPWSWIKIIVNTSVDLRIKPVIRRNHKHVLYRRVESQARVAIVQVRKAVSQGNVVHPQERCILDVVIRPELLLPEIRFQKRRMGIPQGVELPDTGVNPIGRCHVVVDIVAKRRSHCE